MLGFSLDFSRTRVRYSRRCSKREHGHRVEWISKGRGWFSRATYLYFFYDHSALCFRFYASLELHLIVTTTLIVHMNNFLIEKKTAAVWALRF